MTDVDRIRDELEDIAEARKALETAHQMLMRRTRIGVFAGIEAGLSMHEVAELAGVQDHTVEGWWADYRGDHKPAPQPQRQDVRPDAPTEPQKVRAAANDSRVLAAVVRLGGTCRQAQIVASTGLNKGTVSRAVGRLLGDGRLSRSDDGTLSLPAS
jgi:transposase-like protein